MSMISAAPAMRAAPAITPVTTPRASRSRRLRLGTLRRYVSLLALVLAWQAASAAGLLSPRILAAPTTILATGWGLVVSGELPAFVAVSLRRVAIGAGIGVTAGTVLALLSGLTRLGEDIVDAPLQAVRWLPFLALVPVFIMWFGIGELPKVALIALGCTFPVYLNLFAGIRGIDPKLLEAGRVFGLGRLGIVRHIVLPGALPSLLVGVRYALGVAWLALVVAEQIAADSGLGYMVNNARDFLQMDVINVALILYATLGLLSDAAVRAVETRVLAWRPTLVRR